MWNGLPPLTSRRVPETPTRVSATARLGDRAQDTAHLVIVESIEVMALRAARWREPIDQLQLVRAELVGAVRGDDDEPVTVGRPQEVTEDAEGRVIGPVEVVDQQHERAGAHCLEHRGEILQEAQLFGGGIGRVRRRRRGAGT